MDKVDCKCSRLAGFCLNLRDKIDEIVGWINVREHIEAHEELYQELSSACACECYDNDHIYIHIPPLPDRIFYGKVDERCRCCDTIFQWIHLSHNVKIWGCPSCFYPEPPQKTLIRDVECPLCHAHILYGRTEHKVQCICGYWIVTKQRDPNGPPFYE